MHDVRSVFKTEHHVIMYPASGTGAWEGALVNTLSPGDKLLMAETGQFAALWIQLAKRFNLVPEVIAGDWRHAAHSGSDDVPSRTLVPTRVCCGAADSPRQPGGRRCRAAAVVGGVDE